MLTRLLILVILCGFAVTPGWAGNNQSSQFSGYLLSPDGSPPPIRSYFSGNVTLILLPLGRKTEECWGTSGMEREEFKLTANVMPNGDVTDVLATPANEVTACVSEALKNLHLPAPSADLSEGNPLPFYFVYARRR